MEHIKTAIASASETKPVEFKAAIDAELKSRIYDSLLNKKMELANAVFNQYDESDEEDDKKEEQPKPKRVIRQNYSKVKFGGTARSPTPSA